MRWASLLRQWKRPFRINDKVTHPQKLNSVLHVLLASQTKLFADKPIEGIFTLAWICEKVAGAADEWEVRFISERLLNDGYVEIQLIGTWQKPVLTPSGIKFIQAGGYVQEVKERELDRQIKEQTLQSLKRSKTAITISIFAILVPSVISIIALRMSMTAPTTEEVQELRGQVHTLTGQADRQQRQLDSLRTVSADSLRTARSGR